MIRVWDGVFCQGKHSQTFSGHCVYSAIDEHEFMIVKSLPDLRWLRGQ